MKPSKPWYRRVWVWILFSLCVVLIAARIALTPVVKWATQKGLDSIDGMVGTFNDVSVSVFTLSYTIKDLKLYEQPVAKDEKPTVYVEALTARLMIRELVKFHINGVARIQHAKAIVPMTLPGPEIQRKAKKVLPDVASLLEAIIPFKVGRVEILDSEVLAIDQGPNPKAKGAKFWVHDIEMTMENLTNKREFQNAKPLTLSLSCTLQQSGKVSVYATNDPLAKSLTVAGQAEIKGFKLSELHDFIAPRTGFNIEKGTFDMFASFKIVENKINGSVKPIVKNVEITAVDEGLINRFKAALANGAVRLLSDRVEGRDAIVTIIPLRGNVQDPDMQVLPIILNVVRNAFIEGIASGFTVTPRKPGDDEGIIEQTRQALTTKDNAKKGSK